MTTRERVCAAAQFILDAGLSWEAQLASLGAVAQQAAHFGIARASMTKLRAVARLNWPAVREIVDGRISLDGARRKFESGYQGRSMNAWTLAKYFDRLPQSGHADFFRMAFARSELTAEDITNILVNPMDTKTSTEFFLWAMHMAGGGTFANYKAWSDSNRRASEAKRASTSHMPSLATLNVLGLSWPVTEEEVKKAYRAKVKGAHPDHGGTSEAFAKVQNAYKDAMGIFKK